MTFLRGEGTIRRSEEEEVRAHERPALRHGRKTMRSFEICPTSFANLAQPRKRCREAKNDHMTVQEPCSAVATTLATGGEAGAEAVVQEDPAVLRLRRAMPLPPAMGIA